MQNSVDPGKATLIGSDCINSWELLTLENLHADLINTCFEPQ